MARNARAQITLSAVDKTKGAFTAVRGRLNAVNQRAKQAAVVGVAALTAGFAILTARAFSVVDSLAKTADKMGLTTQALAGLQQAAVLTGVEMSTLNKGLQNMQRSIGEVATQGKGLAEDALTQLNLKAEDLVNLSVDEQFNAIAGAMANITNSTQKVTLAYQLFGGRATSLLNTLALGSEGLAEVEARAIAYGTALNRVDANKIERANDAITEGKEAIKGLATTFAVALAPAVEAAAAAFSTSVLEAEGFKETAGQAVEILIRLLGFLADRIQDVFRGFLAIKAAAAKLVEFVTSKLIAAFEAVGKDVPAGLQRVADTAGDIADETFNRLIQSIDAGRISEKLNEFWETAKRTSEEGARAFAASVVVDPGDQIIDAAFIAAQTEAARTADAEAAAIASSLTRLEESLQTALEREIANYEARRLLVEENLEAEGAQAVRRAELLEGIERQHQDNLTALANAAEAERLKDQKGTEKSKLSTGLSFARQTLSASNSASKKQFALQKALNLAQAAVDLPAAVLGAYKVGVSQGGPVVGAAFAALAAATGLAQISKIRSASFGGGGSVGSISGGGGSAGAGGVRPEDALTDLQDSFPNIGQETGRVVHLTIVGNIYGGDEGLTQLVDEIADRINNADQVIIEAGSTQAQILAEAA